MEKLIEKLDPIIQEQKMDAWHRGSRGSAITIMSDDKLEMNFDICTSDLFTEYKQEWFFKTSSMNIATSAIKVSTIHHFWLSLQCIRIISVCRHNLEVHSNLCIHTDWDVVSWWKTLELSHIPEPKNLAKRLNNKIK